MPVHTPDAGPGLIIDLPNFGPVVPSSWDDLFVRAAAADRVGIDGLWVGEHVVLGEALDIYGSPTVGGVPGEQFTPGAEGYVLDPLITLAAVCGVTSRIRLMSAVLLAALRRPAILATTCATLDVLSGGRLDVGVGIGWQREEYEACGLEFERRGRLLDHVLEVCQTLWTDVPASHRSAHLSFGPVRSLPRPVRSDGVPVLVSGTSSNHRALRRLVRFGSGWLLWGEDKMNPAPAIDRIRQAMADAGRSCDGLRIVGTLVPVLAPDGRCDLRTTMRPVGDLVAAGVTDLRLTLDVPPTPGAAEDRLSEVLNLFRVEGGLKERSVSL